MGERERTKYQSTDVVGISESGKRTGEERAWQREKWRRSEKSLLHECHFMFCGVTSSMPSPRTTRRRKQEMEVMQCNSAICKFGQKVRRGDRRFLTLLPLEVVLDMASVTPLKEIRFLSPSLLTSTPSIQHPSNDTFRALLPRQ